jgi:hypothetical protein
VGYDAKHKTQNTKHKTQNTKHKTQNTKHKTQNTKHKSTKAQNHKTTKHKTHTSQTHTHKTHTTHKPHKHTNTQTQTHEHTNNQPTKFLGIPLPHGQQVARILLHKRDHPEHQPHEATQSDGHSGVICILHAEPTADAGDQPLHLPGADFPLQELEHHVFAGAIFLREAIAVRTVPGLAQEGELAVEST